MLVVPPGKGNDDAEITALLSPFNEQNSLLTDNTKPRSKKIKSSKVKGGNALGPEYNPLVVSVVSRIGVSGGYKSGLFVGRNEMKGDFKNEHDALGSLGGVKCLFSMHK